MRISVPEWIIDLTGNCKRYPNLKILNQDCILKNLFGMWCYYLSVLTLITLLEERKSCDFSFEDFWREMIFDKHHRVFAKQDGYSTTVIAIEFWRAFHTVINRLTAYAHKQANWIPCGIEYVKSWMHQYGGGWRMTSPLLWGYNGPWVIVKVFEFMNRECCALCPKH